MAKISQIQYGINKIPAQKDCLKIKTVIIMTIINRERHIKNAFFICLYIKNTQPQLKFKSSWTKKRKIAISLLKEFGEKSSRTNETAISMYKILQAPRKTALGGVNFDLFKLS